MTLICSNILFVHHVCITPTTISTFCTWNYVQNLHHSVVCKIDVRIYVMRWRGMNLETLKLDDGLCDSVHVKSRSDNFKTNALAHSETFLKYIEKRLKQYKWLENENDVWPVRTILCFYVELSGADKSHCPTPGATCFSGRAGKIISRPCPRASGK